ncbi:hypothetical protein [Agrococcus sp. Marseille-Q4369]|uniref:hypothetical protein n=1 Tax=Agrococcus sp. Marseille-Q4369 TaxID=2810513 RepID=UPI001B8B81F8|nr:hypothetical protein [Agrococcus sp. Marseille-Q4369]QUW19784.1 hypothetical protein JSQ78_05735 [Agrococcus sp. Marseille-Q4369]
MHYLLGLAALLIGVVIATRRTRPTWFVVLTAVLIGIGALLAVLSYARVTDSLGLVANNVLGWTYVGLSIITMLSAVFVLERRGEFGEELPPLIGDNPLDGDTDDSDDLPPGQPHPDFADAAAERARQQAEARSRAEARGSAGLSAGVAGGAGAAAATAAAFGDGVVPTADELGSDPAANRGGTLASDAVAGESTGAGAAQPEAGTRGGTIPEVHPGDTEAPRGYSPAPEEGHQGRDEDAADAGAGYRPGPSEDAQDGTAVIGADPDIHTPADETDVEAAPEGRADDAAQHGERETDAPERD